MSKSFDEIVAIMVARRSADSPIIRRMQAVRDKYNGETAILLPDVAGEPEMVPPIAQIVTDAVDFQANRAASSKPFIQCPAIDMGKEKGKGSQEFAAIRRRALAATWYDNAVAEVLLRRAFRHYFGYGTWCLIALPDREAGVRVELRDPLSTYPELRSPEDIHAPLNIGFVYGRSATWIAATYPEAAALVGDDGNRMWDMVEWVDEDDIVVGILGARDAATNPYTGWDRSYGANHLELRRWPNRAGMVPVAIPRRVTLDRVAGQVWAAVGQQGHLERLTALEMAAAERFVFPDMVVLGRDGRTPMLVSGTWKDGRSGEANFVQDGDIKLLQASPGVMTMPTLDRVQENAMKTAGLVPQAHGQTWGALRTGRAIDALGGFSTDPRIQEAQEVTARALATLNEGIISVYRGYFPGRRFTKFSGWPGDGGEVSFVPSKHLETTANVVSYNFPGSDTTEISVGVGQLVGLRLMSRHTGRQKHPWIDDPNLEETRVVEEMLEDAILQNFLQQGATGALPLIDQARVMQLVRRGTPITDAILQADEEARARQAAEAAPVPDGAALPPNAMAGLALPGQGAESVPATEALNPIGAPPQASQDAAQLFRALRAGAARG